MAASKAPVADSRSAWQTTSAPSGCRRGSPVNDRLSRFRNELRVTTSDRRHFLVGAAIGSGMAAQSAVRGGADFLLAPSAGRMRCIGEPSIAAMLPLRECNELVMNFARAEILPRATVPVFF